MTPDELSQLLDAYRDGDISADDAARLAAAVESGGEEADWVRRELAAAGWIAQALDPLDDEAFVRGFMERLRAEDAPEDFVRDFRERVECPRPGSASRDLWRRWWPASIALAACIAIAVALWARQTAALPMARLESVQGEVFVIRNEDRTIAQAGQELFSGQGLKVTGEESAAALVYADGTRLEISSDTNLTELSEGKPTDNGAAGGKRVVLAGGYLTASVAKQPPGRPMILTTPHAEVAVLGTEFSLSGGTEVTYVETTKGKVRLTRHRDGESIEVPANFDAVVTRRDDVLASRPQPARFDASRLFLEDRWAGALSPDGRTLAASSYLGGELELWDLATRQPRSLPRRHNKRIFAAVFTPDGQTLATGGLDRSIHLWDVATGRLRATLGDYASQVRHLQVSADGTTLLAVSGEPAEEKRVSFWDLATHERRKPDLQFPAWLYVVSWDGQRLATSSQPREDQPQRVLVHDLDSGRPPVVLDDIQGSVLSMAFSPAGNALAVAASSGELTLWDLDSRDRQAALGGFRGKVRNLAFSPDGRLLAISHHLGTTLYDVVHKRRLALFIAAPVAASVREVRFSANGQTLVATAVRPATSTAARSGIVQVWDLAGAVAELQNDSPEKTR